MKSHYLLVHCNCPNRQIAESIAEAVILERIAAAVNIVPNIDSIYYWQGQLERKMELLLMIKTHADKYSVLETRIRELHPYEVPGIIALPMVQGSADYLAWIDDNVTGEDL